MMIKAIGVVLVCGLASLTSIAVNAQEKFLTGPAAVEAIRGSWGGGMDKGKGQVTANIVLEEAYFDVTTNPWQAKIQMKLLVVGADTRVVIDAEQRNGQAGDGEVRFPAAQWTRLIVKTGQKNTFMGNPLVLRMLEDKRLSFHFEGDGGFSGTLIRRTANAPPAR